MLLPPRVLPRPMVQTSVTHCGLPSDPVAEAFAPFLADVVAAILDLTVTAVPDAATISVTPAALSLLFVPSHSNCVNEMHDEKC